MSNLIILISLFYSICLFFKVIFSFFLDPFLYSSTISTILRSKGNQNRENLPKINTPQEHHHKGFLTQDANFGKPGSVSLLIGGQRSPPQKKGGCRRGGNPTFLYRRMAKLESQMSKSKFHLLRHSHKFLKISLLNCLATTSSLNNFMTS